MVQLNRLMLAVELFCHWLFLSADFEPIVG